MAFFDPDDAAWSEQALASHLDGHFVRLRHGSYPERSLDDARLALLHLNGVPAWPTPLEAYLYEDKVRAAWLLSALGVPHAPTRTFHKLADAREHHVIRAGDVWFAHGKRRTGSDWRYSGSGVRDWELPSERVLEAGAAVMTGIGMSCCAVDLLETPDGTWRVLEIQPWYEGFRAAQMDVQVVPSVARRDPAGGWQFEARAPDVHRGHALRLLAFDRYLGTTANGAPPPPSVG